MPEWDLEAITAKWQARWWQAKVHHAERPAGAATPWWSGEAGAAGPSEPPLEDNWQGAPAEAVGPAGAGPPGVGSAVPAKPTFFIHFAYPADGVLLYGSEGQYYPFAHTYRKAVYRIFFHELRGTT